MPRQRQRFKMAEAVPVTPLEPALTEIARLCEHVPDTSKVVALPCPLCQVHIGQIQQAANRIALSKRHPCTAKGLRFRAGCGNPRSALGIPGISLAPGGGQGRLRPDIRKLFGRQRLSSGAPLRIKSLDRVVCADLGLPGAGQGLDFRGVRLALVLSGNGAIVQRKPGAAGDQAENEQAENPHTHLPPTVGSSLTPSFGVRHMLLSPY